MNRRLLAALIAGAIAGVVGLVAAGMKRPTRATAAGQAYLDLQNRARAEGRATQELLTLYVVERWLARLSMSPYADQFIIKGGMLLAAYDARRPTAI